MKTYINRILALLLALLIGISTMGGVLPAASAEETEATDAYVLSYKGSAEGYAYNGYPYMYKSPIWMEHTYYDFDAGTYLTSLYSNEIFHLINTTKLAEGGEGAYASIAGYCTDVSTGTRSDTVYRRINLEDSTYHLSGAAGRLRAVILNTFPYIQDMGVITQAANVWLQANGRTLIEQLQVSEAMVATQQAVWKLTHGEDYTIVNHYDSFDAYDGSGAVSTINENDAETEFTATNIEGLYQYLMTLDAMAPLDDAVSEATFENVVYNAVKQEDGTYTVTVSFRVNTTVGAGDSLTLTATCGENVQSIPLTQGGDQSFSFEGLANRPEVDLEITGYQAGGDVYLFDATGDRTHSQSMVGYDSSTLPVYGKVTATPDRVLNIYKTTSEVDGKAPLANIEFELYFVATVAQLESGEVTLGTTPSSEEIIKYQKAENLVATLVTDVQGHAAYNFTANGQPDGVYMVVEKFSPATTGPVEQFYVMIPGTTQEGDGYAYTVTVNPKNGTESGPVIGKDVTSLDNDSDTFDVGETHTWIIRGGIPAGIGTARKYVITDTLDYRLTYTQGSPIVTLADRTGVEYTLTREEHYTLAEGTVTVDGRTVDQFTVCLTEKGMAYVAQNLGAGTEFTPEIRVYFKAVINENASMGQQIPNQATLEYTNSAGVDYESESDIPEVHTGGTNILKVDASGKALAGAVFKIAREAAAEELADESIHKEQLTIGEDETITVVFEAFHAAKDLSGEKVSQVTTDENGEAVLYGLAYGQYYIVETKAPAGYNLLTAPIAVTIDEQSHLTAADFEADAEDAIDNTIRVVNTRFVLPDTGGMGTTVFTVTGIAIMGSAALLLLMNSKKKRC